jgi:fructose-1,6-bisphosphatase I
MEDFQASAEAAMIEETNTPGQIITIERHILEEQSSFPEATGTLTNLLYDIALAGKIIASKTNRAGLAEILGRTGDTNIQGEQVQKLDQFADNTFFRMNDHTGRVALMASEEHADILPIPEKYPAGKYVLLYDPLDGSSNIDYNICLGTIFCIYHKISAGRARLEDCLQKGRQVVAAGYLFYGTSTMLVYSTGRGVNGFTLDPAVGEFLLSHPAIRIPEPPSYYSANQGNQKYWSKGIDEYTAWLQGQRSGSPNLSARYIGSLVADFHRNLLAGGVFFYPADTRDAGKSHGKLRLLYEAIPLAFLAEQAGGRGSDGTQNILDISPHSLHQRTPFFVGNRELVEQAESFIRIYG